MCLRTVKQKGNLNLGGYPSESAWKLVTKFKKYSCSVTWHAGTGDWQRYSCTILDPGPRRGRVNSVSPRPLYPRERDPELTAEDAGWVSWSYGWTWKISPPQVFQLRAVHSQQVFNTAWAIWPNFNIRNVVKSRLGSLTHFLYRLPCIIQ